MNAPFDKAFKLLAEGEDLALLRVVAKLRLPPDAKVEHLDRELDLPTLHVDHLYRITSESVATAVHLEAFARYDSDWRRRHCRYCVLVWAKHELPLMSFMFLLTDRGVPKELDERVTFTEGDLEIGLRVRIVKMWEVPAGDLIDSGDPALMAWVPLTSATPEQLRRATAAVSQSGDPELHSRMALLYGLRYLGIEALEAMLTEEIIKESSFYKKIMKIGLAEGRDLGKQEGLQEGKRQLLRSLLTQKFGPLSDATEARLSAATLDELERWAYQMLDANTIDEVLN